MDDADEKRLLADKLRLALDLQQAGIDLMRQNLRRRHPDESGDEIDARLRTWLRRPPATGHGELTPPELSRVDERV